MDVHGLITAADYDPKTNELILLGYRNKTWIPFMWLFSHLDNADFRHANKRRIMMPRIITTQTEGISYAKNKSVFISSEATKIGKQSLYSFNTNKWTGTGKEQGETLIEQVAVKSNKKLLVTLKSMIKKPFKIQVYDHYGDEVKVRQSKLKNKKGKPVLAIKIEPLKKGKYFVKLTIHSNKSVKAFMVK